MVKRYRLKLYYLYVILFPNGKRYFGITYDPRVRYLEHLKCARGIRSKAPVHEAIRKYGVAGALFKVLVTGRKDYISQLEVLAIAEFDSLAGRNGYNISPGGDISPMTLADSIAKLSATNKLRAAEDPEFRQHLLVNAQKAQLPELIAKRVATRKVADELRGGVSTETRAKMSASHKDKPQRPDWVAKKAASRIANGKKWSEESRLQASASQKLRFERERLERLGRCFPD
jgi:hypothetical protein